MADSSQSASAADNRITCTQCHNLRGDGRCNAAVTGKLPYAGQQYRPMADAPQRCVCFIPRPGEPDRRSALERWPSMFEDAAA